MRDANGLPIGTAHDDPILDIQIHEAEHQDGHKASLAANAIAMNVHARFNDEGNRCAMFDGIVDHQTD